MFRSRPAVLVALLALAAVAPAASPLRDPGGAGPAAEAAERAVAWLAGRQGEDGSYGGSVRATALALLALREAGGERHSKAISEGTAWLAAVRDAEGRFGNDRDQPFAVLALLRASAPDGPEGVREAAHAAAGALVRAGPPREAADGAWSLLALRVALAVPIAGAEAASDAIRFDMASAAIGEPAAILARVFAGTDPRTCPWIREGARRCADRLLLREGVGMAVDAEDLYLSTVALREAGGGEWRAWRNALPGFLLPLQRSAPDHLAGSFDGGPDPVEATALALLGLEAAGLLPTGRRSQ